REVDGNCCEVFFEARQLGGAWDGNNPRLLGKQPSERDLSRGGLLPYRDLAKEIHERPIRFPVLWRKARDDVAEITFVELRIFADLSGEEAFSQRAKWNEADSEFLERGYHFRFRFSEPERVLALQCGDGLNFVCATDGLHAGFRKAEVLHLALLNQLFHRSSGVFDRHVGVNAVLIEQIDDIGLEALQRGLSDFLDVLWTAVQNAPTRFTLGGRP